MLKVLLVINPHAGKGKIKGNLVDIVDTIDILKSDMGHEAND